MTSHLGAGRRATHHRETSRCDLTGRGGWASTRREGGRQHGATVGVDGTGLAGDAEQDPEIRSVCREELGDDLLDWLGRHEHRRLTRGGCVAHGYLHLDDCTRSQTLH